MKISQLVASGFWKMLEVAVKSVARPQSLEKGYQPVVESLLEVACCQTTP